MGYGQGQIVIEQQHGMRRGAGAVGQNLGVSGELDSGRVQPFFMEWAGHDSVGAAGQTFIDGVAEPMVGRSAGCRRDLPEFHGG